MLSFSSPGPSRAKEPAFPGDDDQSRPGGSERDRRVGRIARPDPRTRERNPAVEREAAGTRRALRTAGHEDGRHTLAVSNKPYESGGAADSHRIPRWRTRTIIARTRRGRRAG